MLGDTDAGCFLGAIPHSGTMSVQCLYAFCLSTVAGNMLPTLDVKMTWKTRMIAELYLVNTALRIHSIIKSCFVSIFKNMPTSNFYTPQYYKWIRIFCVEYINDKIYGKLNFLPTTKTHYFMIHIYNIRNIQKPESKIL